METGSGGANGKYQTHFLTLLHCALGINSSGVVGLTSLVQVETHLELSYCQHVCAHSVVGERGEEV